MKRNKSNNLIIKNFTIENEFIQIKSLKKNVHKIIAKEIKNSTYELSLIFVDDEFMKELNSERRGIQKTTDVLSFPNSLMDLKFPYIDLGEIYISVDVLKKQACQIGHKNTDEMYRLIVHGFLHLIGYDHEISRLEEIKMQKKEDELLELILEKGDGK